MKYGYIKRFSIFFVIFLFLFAAPTARAKDDALCHTVFFGDSTTAHMASRGGIPRERVWSGAGNTVLFETVNRTKCVHLHEENMDLTLVEAVAMKKPENLVITLGVSGGAGLLPEDRFIGIYREMLLSVRDASPETRIFVQSILPLSRSSVLHFKKLNRDAVVRANRQIEALCKELQIPYLNTHDLLIDETGYLRILYQNDEYMHLTSAAYDVIREQVETAIRKASNGQNE